MEKLAIGIIRRSYGVRGLVRVASLSGEQEHFLLLQQVALRKAGREVEFEVESCRTLGSDLLMKLRGIDNPEEAQKYSSWEVVVPREKAAPLRDGEYYIGDLCRCGLVFQGKTVGTIRSVLDVAAGQMLEVLLPGGKTAMIPFVNEHVGEVDLEAGTVELKSERLLS